MSRRNHNVALRKLAEPLSQALRPEIEKAQAEALSCAVLELARAVTALALAVGGTRVVQAVSKIEVTDG